MRFLSLLLLGITPICLCQNLGDILINEIVTDPQYDWSDIDFDKTQTPITGAGSNDEWVELIILKDNLDLTNWTIELLDGTDVSGDLTNTGAFQTSHYLSENGGTFSNTKNGDYLILGNVKGAGNINNTSLSIILKGDDETIIDQVNIGGQAGEAPSGNASDFADQSLVRTPNGINTNDNSTDFVKSFSTLGLSNSSIPLPVTFEKFNIYQNGDFIHFEWSTASEINNDGFTIEQAIDASNFLPIATVKSKGNATMSQSYHYSTLVTFSGTNYFRVKQTDYDNSSSYSLIKPFTIAKPPSFEVFPVPCSDELFIQCPEKLISLNLYDVQNKLIDIDRYKSHNKWVINTLPLKNGIYLLKINYKNQSVTKRISIAH